MPIERILISRVPDSPEGKEQESQDVDALLEQFPPQLQQRWSEEIEGMSDEEAAGLLRSVLNRRNQTRTAALSSYELTDNPDAVAMALNLRDSIVNHGVEIGRGGVANVLADPSSDALCYKVIRDKGQYSICNTIAEESDFLETLSGFSAAGVRSPRPYYTIVAPEFVALGMERIPGLSLEQMLALPALPPSFDMKNYFKSMHEYVDALMGEHHILHRDLRPGNLMFDPETGAGYVIDFGRAVHAYPDERDMLEFTLHHRQVRAKDTSHEDLKKVEMQLKNKFG